MLTFLRLVLLDFFDVFPPNGRFVLAVAENPKLAAKPSLVILLRLVFFAFLNVLPSHSRFVLTVPLNSEFPTEARSIV